MQLFTVVMAQIDTLVGDIDGNTSKIIRFAHEAETRHQAEVVLFPELTLTGYPPEDLLLRDSLETRVNKALAILLEANKKSDSCWVIGAPQKRQGKLTNCALALSGGEVIHVYAKQHLPNYEVFDEHRYFIAGEETTAFTYKGMSLALTICEDVWFESPMSEIAKSGVDCVLNLSASPFHLGKGEERLALIRQRITETSVPVIYCNAIGGQDELVFDGGSMALSADRTVGVQADFFTEGLYPVVFEGNGSGWCMQQGYQTDIPTEMSAVYDALVLGVRDYVNKNGFKGVLLGLSGGIDSALTLAIAVDALGADRVMAVMMPFTFTSAMSREDAALQAKTLGVDYDSIAIEPMYDAFVAVLGSGIGSSPKDKTEENLQARCRGVLLMALSNRKGYMVLTTGNKSEMSVGYATLYGDMCGGFNALKDVPKTRVFALAEYVNKRYREQGGAGDAIPQRVIDRPPSAELAEDQKDEDSLPPYDVLDAILERYIERDMSAEAIIAEGFDKTVVYHVLRLVDLNEYKRRQAVVGVRISRRGFGRDRRYPMTNGWSLGV